MNENWSGLEWESGMGLTQVSLRVLVLVVPRGA
jgi:hypothetical protein